MKFLQTMEFRTTHIDEIDALMRKWMAATDGKRTLRHEIQARDREQPDTYMVVAEFPSYEEAMRNNDLPETADFAAQIESLTDGPVTFRNFDVFGEING